MARAWFETTEGVLRLRPFVQTGLDGPHWAVPAPQILLPRLEPSDEPPRFLMLDGDWVER